jgi:hypothetical protein
MTLDVEQLAREAGFIERAAFNHTKELESFAALVLEAAAVEFNQPHMELFMDQIQDAIRAMKPGVKP